MCGTVFITLTTASFTLIPNLTTASFTLIPSNGVKILGWLVCKAVAYGLVNLFSKIACYGTNNDFESLLVVFSMV